MQQVSESVYLLSGAANIGIITGAKGLIVIDTGIDKSAGKRILKASEGLGKPITSIINTHGHSDHIGGNNYIVKQTGAKVYAPWFEDNFLRQPELEPQYLFCGATPIKELKTKFYLAEASPVDYILKDEKLNLSGKDLKIVPLPGHTPGQIGIAVEDVLFTADSFFQVETLDKHTIPFCSDWGKSLETLDFLKQQPYKIFIPAHGTIINKIDLEIVLDVNRSCFARVIKDVETLLSQSLSTSEILEHLITLYEIKLLGPSQYYLLTTTLMACLSYLRENGRISLQLDKNNLRWKK